MNKLEIKYIPINDIRPYEKNPRINEAAVKYVAESIKEYGWRVPIVIDKNNVIVAGHTRYKAAKRLKIEAIPVIVADDLTPEQIRAYRIADNKVADYSIWDNKILLEELQIIGEDIFTGFDFSETFDVLDDTDNTPIELNNEGFMYELVIKSESKEKIEKIKNIWEQIKDE